MVACHRHHSAHIRFVGDPWDGMDGYSYQFEMHRKRLVQKRGHFYCPPALLLDRSLAESEYLAVDFVAGSH